MTRDLHSRVKRAAITAWRWSNARVRHLRDAFNPRVLAGSFATAAAEKFLEQQGIAFQRRCDGSLLVSEPIYLNNRNLKQLPDLTCVYLDSSFHCQKNQLTDLKGAPRTVTGAFMCEENKLTSLEGAPEDVGAAFNANENLLETLDGAPRRVGNYFGCAGNKLKTLKGGPEIVGDTYWCDGNNLESLRGMPEDCPRIVSDFGRFDSWDAVPEDVRISPAESAADAAALDHARTEIAEKSVVLQDRLTVSRPLTLKPAGA